MDEFCFNKSKHRIELARLRITQTSFICILNNTKTFRLLTKCLQFNYRIKSNVCKVDKLSIILVLRQGVRYKYYLILKSLF